jgi:hypothetical protein
MRTVDIFVLAAAGVIGTAACNWTEFDNLADEAWVGATKKPDGVNSSDYGVAITRVALSGTGGKLGILAAGAPGYSELSFSATGESSVVAAQQLPNIGGVGATPLLIANPESDQVAAIVPSNAAIAVFRGGGGALALYSFGFPDPPDAATYVTPPGGTDPLPLVGSKNTVFGVRADAPPNPHPTCKLVDSAMPSPDLRIAALGAVPRNDGGPNDVLMWATNGKLYRYGASVYTGCDPGVSETLANAIMHNGATFTPEIGAQILTIDAGFVLLQGHSGANGVLAVVNTSTLAVVSTVAVPGLRTAAVLSASTKKFAIAGSPTASVEGKSSGQVTVYEISTGGMINTTPVATLHDAQPEDTQAFGRGVAALPFNDSEVLAVAANNEIFVYFRTNFYEETR